MNVLLALIIAVNTYIGVSTVYLAENWEGQPLYCNNGVNGLDYSPDTGPWGAMDIGLFQSGAVQCGDWLQVSARDGSFSFYARAWDSGNLHTATFRGQPVVVDVPEYYAPWYPDGVPCPEVTVINWSAVARELAAAESRR